MRTHIFFAASALALALYAAPVLAAPAPGSLVKIACPNGAAADHPCKAVYFYGSDAKRHAFPNEKVYFSWYADFGAVKTISSAEMASLPLGQNVTYRPGITMVKFTTDDRVFAVGLGGTLRWITSEQAAQQLYGADWNTRVHDIADTFFTDYRFGADVASASAFDRGAESGAAPSVDDNLPATRRSITVTTPSGNSAVDVLKLHKDRFTMKTVTGNGSDCGNACVARPLKEYADANGALYAIHGTYFCPPDYADCAGKTNTFLWPVFDSPTGVMVNAGAVPVHRGPMLIQTTDGAYRLLHRSSQLGSTASSLLGAIANYPSLRENGVTVVQDEPMLEDAMRTTKATRGGIGYDERFLYLVIARNVTVPDLAEVFRAIGATDAMNLDGGGSVALLFNGAYAVGPGRQLPNAVVFAPR